MDAPDIRFITRKWPPAIGGMETYSARLTEELAKRRRIEILALPGRKSGREPSAFALFAFGIRTAIRLLHATRASIVHVADVASWPLAWLASLRHPASRIILSAHGSDVSYARRRGWRSAFYRLYIRIGAAALGKARIIANSEYIAALCRCAGFERVSVVPIATDFQGTVEGARRDLLFAGRISRAKGLRFIVEQVLPLVREDVRLRVAGTVWEDSERELLSRDRVDYLGPLSPAELAREFSRSRAVLIPTRQSEGFGLVAVEAASCGAFVLASDHSGLTEVVREPIGQTVDADDPIAWASAIDWILSWPDAEREARAAAARAEIERHYRWTRVADATLAIYDAA